MPLTDNNRKLDEEFSRSLKDKLEDIVAQFWAFRKQLSEELSNSSKNNKNQNNYTKNPERIYRSSSFEPNQYNPNDSEFTRNILQPQIPLTQNSDSEKLKRLDQVITYLQTQIKNPDAHFDMGQILNNIQKGKQICSSISANIETGNKQPSPFKPLIIFDTSISIEQKGQLLSHLIKSITPEVKKSIIKSTIMSEYGKVDGNLDPLSRRLKVKIAIKSHIRRKTNHPELELLNLIERYRDGRNNVVSTEILRSIIEKTNVIIRGNEITDGSPPHLLLIQAIREFATYATDENAYLKFRKQNQKDGTYSGSEKFEDVTKQLSVAIEKFKNHNTPNNRLTTHQTHTRGNGNR